MTKEDKILQKNLSIEQEKAVDILEQSLASSDERIRLSSAINVLKAVGLYGLNLIPKGFTDIKDLLFMKKLDEDIKSLSELK
jgi:hypothetical protein